VIPLSKTTKCSLLESAMNQQNQKSKGWRRSIQQDWLSWRVHARYRSGSLELVSSDDVGFRVERESVVAGS
jgi:hypothetical protein